MRGNILYRLINSRVLQSAQFYLFRWLFWRTTSTLKIAKSSPPQEMRFKEKFTGERRTNTDHNSSSELKKMHRIEEYTERYWIYLTNMVSDKK